MMQYKVLVIEDNEDINLLTKATLSYKGYHVCSAFNGKDGLLLAKENNPDLIILDVMMPDMDGYEVLKELKSSEDTKHIKVAFMSAKSQIEEINKGIELGAIKYFIKPFDPIEFLNEVEKILTRIC